MESDRIPERERIALETITEAADPRVVARFEDLARRAEPIRIDEFEVRLRRHEALRAAARHYGKIAYRETMRREKESGT